VGVSGSLSYRERLVVPGWWAVTALVVAGLAAAELHSGAGGWRAVVPYVVLPPVTVAGLALLSRRQIRVEDRVLHVPGARAPLTAFGPPEVLEGQALRLWLGPNADARAWVAVPAWAHAAVRLPVVDPDDDTPYWLVGTRRPGALVAALA
jgi:hypothetical protein